MSRVGLLPHAHKPEARSLAPQLAAWLRSRGHVVGLLPEDAAALGIPEAAMPRDAFGSLDLLVVLGGDGTMLHGVELAGLAGVPVLGVNLGSLGFLTEASAPDVYQALERALAGEGTFDRRSTVEGSVLRSGGGGVEVVGEGINEVSLERGVGGKMIRMRLSVGGEEFCSFGADGMIVATPTGSTAYAFSMRGPVVSPELRCLVVVAVGAHSLFDRPLVVAPEAAVEVAVTHGRGVVVLDGRPRLEVGEGDVLRARVGPSEVRLVRLGTAGYFTRVARRFGLR